jgi:hypothetical protein
MTSLLAIQPTRWIESFQKLLLLAFRNPYFHFTGICLLILLIVLWFLIKRLRALFDQLHRKWNPPAPYQPQLLVYFRNAVLWWCFLLLFALAFMAAAIYLSRYQYVGEGVEVAGTAVHHGGHVEFTSYDGAQSEYQVHGGQVAAGGIFFRFPSWARFLGLRTYHHLVTFRGMVDNQYHYAKPKAEWIESYADRIYVFLYKQEWLEAHYTESVYFPPGKHQILVTHSGYIVR